MRTVDWRTLWEEHAEPGELRRVLCALANSMGGQGGQAPTNCAPSMERIARRAGMRRDSASKWIRTAESEGWVNVGRITGLRNRYYATVPKALAEQVPEGDRPTKPSRQAKRPIPEKRSCPMCGKPVKIGHPDNPSTKAWVCRGHSLGGCDWWVTQGLAPWEES